MNVVSTADIRQPIDLERLGTLPHCRYDPESYRCVYIGTPDMYSKVSVFRSGKLISVGTKEERQARHDLKRVISYLAGTGLTRSVRAEVKLQNLVASVDLEHPLELNRLVNQTSHVIYEPEEFPGVMYHLRDPIGVTILIFASGKAVIAGAKDKYQLKLAAMELGRLAELFESKIRA